MRDLTYPLFTKEIPREEFDRRLRQNPENDALRIKPLLPERSDANRENDQVESRQTDDKQDEEKETRKKSSG